jgi:hypothetical protein
MDPAIFCVLATLYERSKRDGEGVLVPHLADEARRGPLLVHALAAGDRGGVVLALLGLETFEEAVRGLEGQR